MQRRGFTGFFAERSSTCIGGVTRDRALAAYEQERNSLGESEEERVVCACLARLLPTMAPQYASLIETIDLEGEPPEKLAADLSISRSNLRSGCIARDNS